MLAVLSPSKTLDFETSLHVKTYTLPELLEEAEMLVTKLKRISSKKLSSLMGISAKLAEMNHVRYQQWSVPFTPENAKPAVFAFKGDVYEGLGAESFTAKDHRFSQKHLRILSGLYGVLRPLDLIQPYRLEMGAPFATRRGKNLYAFWGDRITVLLSQEFASHKGDRVLLNLASNEYFKAVSAKNLTVRVLATSFKEKKGDEYQMNTFFAKKARGMMAAFVVKNQLTKIDDLKAFKEDGYRFNKKLSTNQQWVFTRDR